jgi:hypothetical protein
VESPNDKISFQAHDNKYCGYNSPSWSVTCNKPKSSKDYTFERIDNEDGTFSFKCAADRYMSTHGDNIKVKCIGLKITEKEKFTLKIVDENKPDQPPSQVRFEDVLT